MKVCVLLLLSFFLVDAFPSMDDIKNAILKGGLKNFEELQDFYFNLCLIRWRMFTEEEKAICSNLQYVNILIMD